MEIREKSVVTLNYKLTGESGEMLDQSGDQPLSYLHGTGAIIPGLEDALEGKNPGDSLSVKISPEDGYGPVRPQLIQKVARSMFQGVEELETGMEFEARGEGDHTMVVRIEKIEEDEVTINGNHPLAGKALNFDVEILEVREASEEELAHGHSHGHGAHH